MTDTTVKYFHSAMVGAPTLSGTAGSLIAILDACLVNGFGSGTLDSLVITGGVAVCTRSAGHPQEVGSVALIAGATVSGGSVNGEQKVTAVTATTFSFATALSNQTATGTITAKFAPAGWAKQYTGTNLAAYKPTDVTATGCLLRVDDTGTQDARVVGYETMSDVNTGTGPFPTSSQVSGGNYWSKSSNANATANPWMLFADGRTVYFARAYRGGNNITQANDYELTMFGDITPTKSGDPYACLISGATSSVASSTVTGTHNLWASNSSVVGLYAPRAYTGLGSSQGMLKNFPNPFFNLTPGNSGAAANTTPFPNPTDGGLYVVPHYITEFSGGIFRGNSPGFYCVPQAVASGQFAPRDSVTGVTGLTGKTLKAITVQNATIVTCFIDATGPWR